MNTTISDQADNGQAPCPLIEKKAVSTPGTTEAAQQAHTTINDQANYVKACLASGKWKALEFPPGMTWEVRQAHMNQYLKDKALADLTAKNTKSNKEDKKFPDSITKNTKSNNEDKKFPDSIAKNTKSKKKIRWSDLPEPSQS